MNSYFNNIEPIYDKDEFGFNKNIEKTIEFIKASLEKTEESSVLLLDGKWGSGKTSFVNLIKKKGYVPLNE